ncbi:Band 4.1-like protein 2 [Bagarius yarrelli]|uniref:Band 4.1-like protein 2 n=1 Tax=Bagarius yarrelli TaxID=175774 RepID=A0A556U9N8_BAGYA|nr:Band 4.1-like protein 2 [Bagarius yarrelli]
MTTEVGSEAEVKKEPEKQPSEEQQVEEPSENAQNTEDKPQPAPENLENPENAEVEPAAPTSPSPSASQKKDKGISRFLPPWLKRQKSLSQVDSKDTPTQTEEEEEPERDSESRESKEQRNSETQLVKDKKEEESQRNGIEEESTLMSPIKPGKKMKMVVCHVTLLDGSLFQCEVEHLSSSSVITEEQRHLVASHCTHSWMHNVYAAHVDKQVPVGVHGHAPGENGRDPALDLSSDSKSIIMFPSFPSSSSLSSIPPTLDTISELDIPSDVLEDEPELERDSDFEPDLSAEPDSNPEDADPAYCDEGGVSLFAPPPPSVPTEQLPHPGSPLVALFKGAYLLHEDGSIALPCPSFFLIFAVFLSACHSVALSLALALPLAVSLCYIEPKAYIRFWAAEDLDKTQEEVFKASGCISISELKRSFMESAPEPRPSQWEKRLTGSPASTGPRPPVPGNEQNLNLNNQPDVIEVVKEIVVIEEVKTVQSQSPTPEMSPAVATVTEKAPEAKEEKVEPEQSGSSESESEEEAEYHAQLPASIDSTPFIKEEPEEEQEQEVELNREATPTDSVPQPFNESMKQEEPPALAEEEVSGDEVSEVIVTSDEAPNGHADDAEALPTPFDMAEEEEEEPCVVNGDASHTETERVPQVICCSEKTEITTKEVPIVHTETKTITYEAAQEAKEQHPDMSVTRVVVHKETELSEDEE